MWELIRGLGGYHEHAAAVCASADGPALPPAVFLTWVQYFASLASFDAKQATSGLALESSTA